MSTWPSHGRRGAYGKVTAFLSIPLVLACVGACASPSATIPLPATSPGSPKPPAASTTTQYRLATRVQFTSGAELFTTDGEYLRHRSGKAFTISVKLIKIEFASGAGMYSSSGATHQRQRGPRTTVEDGILALVPFARSIGIKSRKPQFHTFFEAGAPEASIRLSCQISVHDDPETLYEATLHYGYTPETSHAKRPPDSPN